MSLKAESYDPLTSKPWAVSLAGSITKAAQHCKGGGNQKCDFWLQHWSHQGFFPPIHDLSMVWVLPSPSPQPVDNKAPRNEPFGLRSTKTSTALLTASYCELQHMQIADMCAHDNTSRLAGLTISLLKMSRISSPFLALQGRQPSTNLSTVLLDRTTTKGWHLHLTSGHTSQSCQSWGTVPHLSHLMFKSKRHSISKAPKLATCKGGHQLFPSRYVILFWMDHFWFLSYSL